VHLFALSLRIAHVCRKCIKFELSHLLVVRWCLVSLRTVIVVVWRLLFTCFKDFFFVSNVMCCSLCVHLSMVLLEEFSAGDAFGESRGAGQEPS
jgi:hypothetical protein